MNNLIQKIKCYIGIHTFGENMINLSCYTHHKKHYYFGKYSIIQKCLHCSKYKFITDNIFNKLLEGVEINNKTIFGQMNYQKHMLMYTRATTREI